MMILVTGGSRCGKSALAESLLRSSSDKVYIAAMMPDGVEAQEAIARHRRQRAGKGFETVEKYTDIDELDLAGRPALLECMGNLLANEMFCEHPHKDISGHILYGVRKLRDSSGKLVIVTSDVSGDGGCYTEGCREYIRLLGLINSRIADMADTVIECVFGIPLVLKGGHGICWDL